jgi:arsenate reductase
MHPHRYNFPVIARVSGSKASNEEDRAMTIDFYHNPRCVTSRKALDLLRRKGIEPNIIEYLKTPPSKAQLKKIAELIGVHPRDMLRKREKAALKKAGVDPKTASATAALDAMAAVPVLIERPIIVNGRKARLGRPPEKVLEAV